MASTKGMLSMSPTVPPNCTRGEERAVSANCIPEKKSHLDNADIGLVLAAVHGQLGHPLDPVHDGVGDVGDDLHRLSEVVATSLRYRNGLVSSFKERRTHLLGNDMVINLARCNVVAKGERGIEEALVVAQVQVDLAAVVQHKDLAVLDRVHEAGVNVEVRVNLSHAGEFEKQRRPISLRPLP